MKNYISLHEKLKSVKFAQKHHCYFYISTTLSFERVAKRL